MPRYDTSDAPEEEPMIVTQSEFSAITGFSRSAISKWVKKGIIPVFEIHGRKYIRRDLAMAWLDQHTDGGKAPGDAE